MLFFPLLIESTPKYGHLLPEWFKFKGLGGTEAGTLTHG